MFKIIHLKVRVKQLFGEFVSYNDLTVVLEAFPL